MDGIIVGCTQNQEWLLTWWWLHFRLFNNYPVTFVNFGDMSPAAIDWCRKRGDLAILNISENLIAKQEQVDPSLGKIWETIQVNPSVWQVRQGWFKKPFALLESNYSRTLWIDLDCQIRGSLQPVFETCENDAGIALKEEEPFSIQLDLKRGLLLPGEIIYSSGVIAYKHGSPAIEMWAKSVAGQNHLFFTDQHLLSRLLFTKAIEVTRIPAIYNWRIDIGVNLDAVVLHWVGGYKVCIKAQIEGLTKGFFLDMSLNSREN